MQPSGSTSERFRLYQHPPAPTDRGVRTNKIGIGRNFFTRATLNTLCLKRFEFHPDISTVSVVAYAFPIVCKGHCILQTLALLRGKGREECPREEGTFLRREGLFDGREPA